MGSQLLIFVISLLLLYIGAECLVKGASLFAKKAGISPIIAGLTIVAFGTSSPELLVSISSLYRGKEMIAIGNVVGSNICNFTMVLGIIAIIRPVTKNKTSSNKDFYVMLSASCLFFVLSLNSVISTLDGLVLFLGSTIYIGFSYYNIKREKIKKGYDNLSFNAHTTKIFKIYRTKTYMVLIILFGIIFMIVGSEFLVNASIKIMNILGISEKFIGLTIIAIGTSIPELATSVVAILNKQADISFGNLIGSNLFNILSVVGITALVQPITINKGFIGSGLILDYLAMIFVSTLPLFLMKGNKNISKIKGVFLISLYALYISVLFSRV